MWAADTLWDSDPDEIINCDFSVQMNTLCDLITKNSSLRNPSTIKNISYKRNLPKTSNVIITFLVKKKKFK
jgi:hypothetical protein